MTEEEAHELFESIMDEFRSMWLENYPDEPFEVDGCVTPKALAFIAGYVAGRDAR
jgi:hypothetical protein